MNRPRPARALFSAAACFLLAPLAGCGAAGPPSGTPPTRTASPPRPDAPAAAPAVTGVPAPAPQPTPSDTAVSDISFDDVKLDLAKGAPFTPEALTPRVRELERRRVRIRGYILPSFQQTGLTQFVLVRDNLECCFGPGAALHDCVVVRMAPGKTAHFSIRPVAVTGVFRVEELRGPAGGHLAIYAMEGLEVK